MSAADGDDRALVDRFLDMLAAEAGASRNTLLAYRSDLEAAARGDRRRSSRRRRDELERLGAAWAALAPSTVARRSAALRRFFGFLLDEGLRADDPSRGAAAADAAAAAAARSSIRDEVEAMFAAVEERGGERPAAGAAQPGPARTALRLGAARDRAGVAAAPRGPRRASRS